MVRIAQEASREARVSVEACLSCHAIHGSSKILLVPGCPLFPGIQWIEANGEAMNTHLCCECCHTTDVKNKSIVSSK